MLKFDFLEKRTPKFLMLALSAVLTGVCVCYPQLGILQWVSMIPAALVLFSIADLKKNRLRSVYLYGFFFCMCYFVTVWHWFFVMYPLEFAGFDYLSAIPVVLAAVLGIPLVQSSTFAFVFVLFCKIARGSFAARAPMVQPFLFAALWAIFEWTQTLFWFGVPWGRLAIGQTGLLITLQSSSLLGPYFVSFLIIAVNALVACALYRVNLRKLCSLTCAALFVLNVTFGTVVMLTPRKEENTVKAAAIQGNISSTEKWGANWLQETVRSYSELTAKAAADGAEIVIWPESVFTRYDLYIHETLSEIARENEIVLLAGVVHTKGDGTYNSVMMIMPDGSFSQDVYSKRRPVPFGEYVPWRDFITAVLPMLEGISQLDREILPGEDSNLIETEYGKIGALVCFDSIYETLALDSAKDGAELITIGTNDSWFYDSPAVYMHESQAKMRAIETGKYVVRAANTGVSAIITPQGEVVEEIEPLVEGYIISDVSFAGSNTLYTYIGNLWVWLSVAFVALLLGANITAKILEDRDPKKKGENYVR